MNIFQYIDQYLQYILSGVFSKIYTLSCLSFYLPLGFSQLYKDQCFKKFKLRLVRENFESTGAPYDNES